MPAVGTPQTTRYLRPIFFSSDVRQPKLSQSDRTDEAETGKEDHSEVYQA